MNLPLQLQQTQAVTRRQLLGAGGLGLGSLALGSLLARDGAAKEAGQAKFRLPAKAKSVIYLHMAGSPSQVDLFEHKPALTKFHGQDCPKEYLEGKRFAFIKGVPKMLGPQFKYSQHGETGQWLSELLPGLASVVDDICVIRTVHTDQFNHSPAQLLLHTGNPLLGSPAIGSWITYGIGSENAGSSRVCRSWPQVEKRRAPENRSGAAGFCPRFIKASNAGPTAAIRFCISRTPKA